MQCTPLICFYRALIEETKCCNRAKKIATYYSAVKRKETEQATCSKTAYSGCVVTNDRSYWYGINNVEMSTLIVNVACNKFFNHFAGDTAIGWEYR